MPFSLNLSSLASSHLQYAIIVLISLAVLTILQSSGILKFESRIILTGLTPSSILQLSIGLSAKTVFIPTIIPEYFFLSCWTWSLDCSDVTHLESPVYAAILPSNVIAYLAATNGVFVLM